MIYTIKNESLTVEVETFGAEVRSVKDNHTGVEYMWNADEKFWKRTSPVLFPIVGSLKNKQYTYNKQTYTLPQHGFARDMEFELISHTEEEVWMELKSNNDTLQNYPFEFTLRIGYLLTDNQLKVMWNVVNEETEETMYFSIGAHPAFMCPIHGEKNKNGYGIQLNAREGVLYSRINQDGLMLNTKQELDLDEEGRLMFTEDFFDKGVYIIDDYQAKQVALFDPNGKKYITVEFEAPLFGLWSPEGKNAPFVCIEPWYGRCDRETFTDGLKDREYEYKLKAQEEFEKYYTITFE